MLISARSSEKTLSPSDDQGIREAGSGFAATLGAATGSLAAAAGVGGGILMVPAFAHFLRFSMTSALATSSAAIVLIGFTGTISYMLLGWQAGAFEGTLGYVDFGHASLLALPAAVTARLGVWTAHRIDTSILRFGFAIFAFLVALRLIWNGLSG
jgi:uncharacterized membrane protein YfcA